MASIVSSKNNIQEEAVSESEDDQRKKKAQDSLARIESNKGIPWIYSCFCCACSIKENKRGTWTPMDTNKLEIARKEGLKYFVKNALSLLTTDATQYTWIMSQLVVAVILFGFVIGGLVRDNRTTYDVVRAIVAGVFLLYGIVDALIKLINNGCIACCTIDAEIQSQSQENHSENEASSSASDSVSKRKNTVPKYLSIYKEDSLPSSCKKYLKGVNITLTLIRSIIPEIFFYILFLLHILQHSHSRSYEKFDFYNNKFDGSFFLFVVISYIVMVYMVRIFLWCYVYYSIQKTRKHSPLCCDKLVKKEDEGKPDVSVCGETFKEFYNTVKICLYPDCCLLVRVVFHIVGQMLVQAIMITSIWVKVEYEQQVTNGNPQGFSPYLWCMIAGGFFLPLLGNIAFFIPNYYWIEEFLVGLCIDEIKNDIEEASISTTVQYNELISDYRKMKLRSCFEKFVYPFISPGLVFLSFLYCILLLSFAVFATLSFDENRFTTYVVLDGSIVWIIFFVVGVIFVNVVNIQVVIISGFWCLVVLAILSVICFFLASVCAVIFVLLDSFPFVICILCLVCIACQNNTR